MVSIMPYVITYTVIWYTPSWLYTSFHTDWGPGESSRRAVEDKNPLIRPHAAPVPCYHKSQESNHPTLQSLIQLQYMAGVLQTYLYFDRNIWQKYPTLPCSFELFFPSTLPHPSPLPLFLSSSVDLKLTVCVSAFNFLHHLTTRFYVTVV